LVLSLTPTTAHLGAMNLRLPRTAATLIAVAVASSAWAGPPGEKVSLNFEHALPNAPGKSLTAVVVDYPPGGASPAHTHAKSAFIYAYVVSGAVTSQVDGGALRTYRTGESFYETPGAHHQVSRNASMTEPAKLLAVFVHDTADMALTTPDTKEKAVR
jgi:quercetin dioxygenase-like cupin family protein